MKALIGLVAAGISLPVAWWAFKQAVAGRDSYNYVWFIALIIGALGILTLIAQISKWMKS